MYYTVYKTINIINLNYYIGMHKTDNLKDDYLGSGKLLKRAVDKYGKQYFNKEILFCFDNENEMKLKEAEIVIPRSLDPKSYNLCEGGHGGFGYINSHDNFHMWQKENHHNEKHKSRKLEYSLYGKEGFKIAYQNRGGPPINFLKSSRFKDKKHSETSLSLIANKAKQRVGIKNSSFGTCWITNGINNKKIKKEELDFYITQGYYKGRI